MATQNNVLVTDSTPAPATWTNSDVVYPKLTGGRVAASVMPIQSAIADLNLGTLTLLTDVITAVGTIQTKVNTLLSELRTAGLLTP